MGFHALYVVGGIEAVSKRGVIANAEYKLVGKGGLSLTKWQSVETKMTPVIDQLFAKRNLQKVKPSMGFETEVLPVNSH